MRTANVTSGAVRWRRTGDVPCGTPWANVRHRGMQDTAKALQKKTNRYLDLVQKYGLLVVVFHTGVWIMTLGGVFVALHHEDFNIGWVLDHVMPTSMEDRKERLLAAAHSEYGKFAIAYAIAALTGPPRLGLTLVVAPSMAARVAKLNHPVLNKLLVHSPMLEKLLSPLSFFRRK